MTEKRMISFTIDKEALILLMLVALVAAITVNQYILTVIDSAVSKISITGKSIVTSSAGSTSGEIDQILREIIPTGTPDYGKAAGVSYDDIENSLNVLVGYQDSISLDGAGLKRFIEIGTTKETACEFCCGIGTRGFATADGSLACGCAHNIAFGGLTKWLIKNTDYTNEQIIDEIQKWKMLFFPGPALSKELQKRGINPESAGLAQQVGGC